MQDPGNSINQKIAIYIFSFNRGKFLENCLKSTQYCAPGFDVTVIDDSSTDEMTLQILKEFGDKVEVIQIAPNDSKFNVGGLQNNMNYAFQDALQKGRQYTLIIQDDMQLVRKITEADIASIDKFFEANPNSAQLYTCFMKSQWRDYDDTMMYLDSSSQAYLRKLGGKRHAGYSDVGLFSVQRFFELFGLLRVNINGRSNEELTVQMLERHNNTIAEENGIQVGFYAYPFMVYLPLPITYWRKKRNLYSEFKDWMGGVGFYPCEYMTDENCWALFNRDLSERPYPEKRLNCPGLPHCNVWRFTGGNAALIARGGWRRILGKSLKRIERISF